ncbi:MAG: heavy-metal-associated domain-containing protein [Spirochaetales bacterium]|nr:heavy-metal-associated domain-containing protein [Spirochaetales bacterium]
MKKIVTIEGMSCGSCAMRVQTAMASAPGVTSVKVALIDGKAVVEGDGIDANTLRGAVEKAGYQVVSILP